MDVQSSSGQPQTTNKFQIPNENGSWFNEISYLSSEEKIQEDVLDYISKHPEMDSPFFVANLSEVLDKYNIWKKELPDVELYYAMKACSDIMLLKVLAALGTSFDCASKAEIETILSLRVHPDKIMYSNPFKFVSHLKYAASIGIRSVVFDSEGELIKIHQHHPSAKLVIRVRPTAEINSYLNMGEKFGCSVSEAEDLLEKAKKLCVTVEGISFYVGHCTESPLPYEDAISVSRQVYDFAQKMGHKIEFVDIGGGFQGQEDKKHLFLKVTAGIRRAIKENFPEGIRVIGEPGQFMCLSAFSTYAKVIGTRTRNTDKGTFLSVHLSGGHFGCIPNYNFQFYSPRIELVNISEDNTSRPIVKTQFWGPTCDPMDKITLIPYPTLRTGDWLRVTDTGAYTLGLMSKFNGFEFAPIKYVASPQIRSLLGKEENLKVFSE